MRSRPCDLVRLRPLVDLRNDRGIGEFTKCLVVTNTLRLLVARAQSSAICAQVPRFINSNRRWPLGNAAA